MNTELVELNGVDDLASGKYDKLLAIDPRQLSNFDAAIWGLKLISIMAGPDVTWQQALNSDMQLSGDPRLAGWWTDLKKKVAPVVKFLGLGKVQNTVDKAISAYNKVGKKGALQNIFNKKTPTTVDAASMDNFGKNVKGMFSKIPTAVWLAGGSILLLVIGLQVIKSIKG